MKFFTRRWRLYKEAKRMYGVIEDMQAKGEFTGIKLRRWPWYRRAWKILTL